MKIIHGITLFISLFLINNLEAMDPHELAAAAAQKALFDQQVHVLNTYDEYGINSTELKINPELLMIGVYALRAINSSDMQKIKFLEQVQKKYKSLFKQYPTLITALKHLMQFEQEVSS